MTSLKLAKLKWRLLTNKILPNDAKKNKKFPIRFNHCFQRVALDNAFGGCWYNYLDKKKGTAISQISEVKLNEAIEFAMQMHKGGADTVIKLNKISLKYRNKL